MKVKVIVFVGMPGAGKSVCVDHLVAKGMPSVYFGGITINEVKARGLEVNEPNEKIVREHIRANEGDDAYAKRMIKEIEELSDQGHKTVVADGLYTWTEYKSFKNKFGDEAIIIAVVAPRRLRHARLINRPIRPFTNDEVTAREYAEIENLEKGGPIANADFTILNDGTTKEMLEKLELILKQSG